MTDLLIVTGISFFAGAFGYILYKLIFLPIWQYRKIKRMIAASFHRFPQNMEKASPEWKDEIRKNAANLLSVHAQLPLWYRLAIGNRDESPEKASTQLMKLANTKNNDHARNQVDKIERSLNFTKSLL